MDGMLLLPLLVTYLLLGIRFRHREEMGRSSRTDSQALGLIKELERRVEALDETIQAEVGSYMSYLLFLIDYNVRIPLHIIPRRSSWQFTKTF
jgi:hypothetical protein